MKIIKAMLLLLLGWGTLNAQNADVTGMQGGAPATAEAEVTSTEERISRLEKTLSGFDKIVSHMPDISGFINMRYQYNDADRSNAFDIRRARLDVKGDILKKLDYRFQIEFAGGAKILDAYIRYKLDPRFNVQAGEFKIPFSLENMYGPTSLELADNAMGISRLCNYSDLSGVSANGRDIGVSLYGSFGERKGYHLFDYAVGLFNGNGINVKENNRSKDFSGRVIFRPQRSLAVSGSYYNGSYGDRDKGTHSRERVAAGFSWTDKRLLVRSEYLWGKTGGMESEGVYAVAGYYVHPKVQPLLRYDYFQKDKADSGSRETDYTAGVNFWASKNFRLMANYTYKAVKTGRDANYVAVQFFAQF